MNTTRIMYIALSIFMGAYLGYLGYSVLSSEFWLLSLPMHLTYLLSSIEEDLS